MVGCPGVDCKSAAEIRGIPQFSPVHFSAIICEITSEEKWNGPYPFGLPQIYG